MEASWERVFPLVSGTKSQTKSAPRLQTDLCVKLKTRFNEQVGIGVMMQMVILVLVLGIKMVKTRNQPMEEEDGVQSKGTDEVRQ